MTREDEWTCWSCQKVNVDDRRCVTCSAWHPDRLKQRTGHPQVTTEESGECSDCGGDGTYGLATDSDPSGDQRYTCENCNGSGREPSDDDEERDPVNGQLVSARQRTPEATVPELQAALSEAISRCGSDSVYEDLHLKFGHLLARPTAQRPTQAVRHPSVMCNKCCELLTWEPGRRIWHCMTSGCDGTIASYLPAPDPCPTKPVVPDEVTEARNEAATVRRAYLHEKARAEKAVECMRVAGMSDTADKIEAMAYTGPAERCTDYPSLVECVKCHARFDAGFAMCLTCARTETAAPGVGMNTKERG